MKKKAPIPLPTPLLACPHLTKTKKQEKIKVLDLDFLSFS